VATLATIVDKPEMKSRSRPTLAYGALVVFTFLYYARPEDLIPGLQSIPVGKISGGLALLGLIASLAGNKIKTKLPLEMKLLLAMSAQFCLCIPFATWRGGAFDTVFNKFSKVVITALLVVLIVESIQQLRTLLFIQAASVAVITSLSVIIHPGGLWRLHGVVGGILGNPNDLAINIAINWPLCLAFLLCARGPIKKGLWTLGLLGMLYGVICTYSRSGMMATIVCLLVCLWEFGVRAKRFHVLALAGILAVISVGVAFSTPRYVLRIKSIFEGDIHGARDRGSWEARREILDQSIDLALHNPVFGVGPGNFPSATKTWVVVHNTFTELAAEGGFPALLLFLVILGLAFRNLRRVRRIRHRDEIQVFASAMWASLAAYIVGANFSSTEYNLFVYFMVAYTSVLYRLAQKVPASESSKQEEELSDDNRPRLESSPTQRMLGVSSERSCSPV
jgi:O-antigen ligase